MSLQYTVMKWAASACAAVTMVVLLSVACNDGPTSPPGSADEPAHAGTSQACDAGGTCEGGALVAAFRRTILAAMQHHDAKAVEEYRAWKRTAALLPQTAGAQTVASTAQRTPESMPGGAPRLPQTSPGVSGGFIATLGSDTMHIEQFTRRGNLVEGAIATRVPSTRVTRYSLALNDSGRPVAYEAATFDGDGTPVRAPGTAGNMTWRGDSLVRQTRRADSLLTHRLQLTMPTFPGPTVPYVGVSYIMYELAFAHSRTVPPDTSQRHISLMTLTPGQMQPQRLRIWTIGRDSVELDYFGVARSGYRLGNRGELIRADWSGTTYKYQVRRIAAPDVDSIARAWSALDKRGAGIGVMSPRDTARAAAGAASIIVDYSRPSKRGRVIWGELVPFGKVWRLGADFATHVHTGADLRIGGTNIPAGSYTMWMLPASNSEATLIINRQTGIFGTAYNPQHDFARIPLQRRELAEPVERLSIVVEDGALRIRWDRAEWSVSLSSFQR